MLEGYFISFFLNLQSPGLTDEFSSQIAADLCVGHVSDFSKHPLLSEMLTDLFRHSPLEMVNKTEGSFVLFNSKSEGLEISFYTSGLFDLIPILRTGPVQFCVSNGKIEMRALGRIQTIQKKDSWLIIGSGGPKLEFKLGPMPSQLRKLHGLPDLKLANEAQ